MVIYRRALVSRLYNSHQIFSDKTWLMWFTVSWSYSTNTSTQIFPASPALLSPLVSAQPAQQLPSCFSISHLNFRSEDPMGRLSLIPLVCKYFINNQWQTTHKWRFEDTVEIWITLKFLSIIFSCCHEIIQFSCSRYWILWILLKLLNIVQKF